MVNHSGSASSRARFIVLLAILLLGSQAAFSQEGPNAPAPNGGATANGGGGENGGDLFQLDLENLGKVEAAPATAGLSGAPSTTLDLNEVRESGVATTGELLEHAASVSTRRTSALNIDASVRGYNSQQTNASANGMTELKTRVDIDSLFSQIDPGIVSSVTVVDGPYTSLYGPSFAFLIADLFPIARSAEGVETHGATNFSYNSNGQQLYSRQNISAAGTDWGAVLSYGIRTGNDYEAGGGGDFFIPASYKKWDTFIGFSKDLSCGQRLEFNYLRTEINDLELPGVAYDVNNSRNDQFNVRYVVHDGAQGPERFVFQAWQHDTAYSGDAMREAKQRTVFYDFFTTPSHTSSTNDDIVNVIGNGRLDSTGARGYLRFGQFDDTPYCLVGMDYRRASVRYAEFDINGDGSLAWGGNLYGIPASEQADVGVFTNAFIPLSDTLDVTVGGRLDYVKSRVDENDAVVTQIADPSELYFVPGLNEPAHTLGMAYVLGKCQASDEVTFNAGVAFAMRAPVLAELYSDEPYVPMIRFGNTFVDGISELQSEKNLQFDLGVGYQQGKWRCGARGFCANIFDYILPVPAFISPAAEPGSATYVLGRDFSSFPADLRQDLVVGTTNADQSQAGYTYANVQRVTLWGGDMYFEAPLRENWLWGGTLSYVEGTNLDPQQYVADSAVPTGGYYAHLGGTDPLPGIYPLSGIVRLKWYEPEQELYAVEFITQLVAQQDRVAATLAELPTQGFIVCSVRGHWQASERLRISAGIENLLNTDYTQHGSLVLNGPGGVPTFVKEPGISGVLGMELKY